jgi:transcriptional regulator with XRE-family HTH domain
VENSDHYELVDSKELGRIIKMLRKHRGLTQRQLADLVARTSQRPLDPTFISLVERGQRAMSFPTFLALARAFEVPGEWFVILAFRNTGGRDRGVPAIDELGERLKSTIAGVLFGPGADDLK